jgi:hypothetical protein
LALEGDGLAIMMSVRKGGAQPRSRLRIGDRANDEPEFHAVGLAVLAYGDHRIEVGQKLRIIVFGGVPKGSQTFVVRGASDIDS